MNKTVHTERSPLLKQHSGAKQRADTVSSLTQVKKKAFPTVYFSITEFHGKL